MTFQKKHTRETKLATDFWDEYYKNLQNTEIVDVTESPEEKEKRIKYLEADFERWKNFYFEKYCSAKTPKFHKQSSKCVVNNSEWYEVRAWSRELAKTSLAMMELLYLHCTGKKKLTFILGATQKIATRLLRPYKLAFEKNPRLRNDYGDQDENTPWREDVIATKMGTVFYAVGAGDAPRGSKDEEIRPDSVVVDDYDTDEDCRNPDIVDKKWEFFEQAVYGMRSISEDFLVLWLGNIIADYCCTKKAIEKADRATIINIRDKNGKSTWIEKNSEANIDRVLSKISAASAQKEYFNNPVVLGKIFKKLNYGKIQPLHKYKFLVLYTDPSYKKNGDYKATGLMGKWKDEYHVIWLRCKQTTVAKMIDWQFEALEFVNGKTAVYVVIEYPWIDDTLKREIKKGNKRHNMTLNIKADDRKKPEKFYRIESKLEPLNSNNKLIFNEDLKDTEDMKEAEFQFLGLSPNSRINDDAPDMVEGNTDYIDRKNKQNIAPPKAHIKPSNKQRY